MITSPAWAGKRYAVLGLARSGAATVRALVAAGASVVAWDEDEAKRDTFKPLPFRGGVGGGEPGRSEHADRSIAPHPNPSPEGEGLLEIAPLDDLTGFDALVVSPGVPLNTHPIASAARTARVPIIGDIELFAEARATLPPHKVVGITGTNGKSTTTALVHHILQTAGVPSLMGGNIGAPILGERPLPAGGVYVLELSSYQIDLTRTLDCDVAVLLNITPDHLDRYDSFEAYVASKARLFAMQSDRGVAVLNFGDRCARSMHNHLASTARTLFGVLGSDIGDPEFWNGTDDKWLDRIPTTQGAWPGLQGLHNATNAAVAIAVSRSLGVTDLQIALALESFAGLPHRMERVGTYDGVTYVDDSKATNPESAAPALEAFPRVHWIVGGRAKGDDLDACAPHFGNVVAAYTIGEAGPRFAEVLRPHVAVEEAGTLAEAVRCAAAAAQRGEVVLLAPAAASFDQFTDYVARGNAFRDAVESLR